MKITFGKKSKNKQDNCSNSPTISQHFKRRISNSQQAYGKNGANPKVAEDTAAYRIPLSDSCPFQVKRIQR